VGKNLPWLFVGIRAERQQSPRYPQLKAVLRMCFVQTLQMVWVNCSSEGQRGFYKCATRGQNKFRRYADPELRGDIFSHQNYNPVHTVAKLLWPIENKNNLAALIND
jgi:hypothetical protein